MKTVATDKDVTAFLNQVDDPQKKADCLTLIPVFENIVKAKAILWGNSIVGFGQYHYKYDSGREGDFMITGFSPRKNALTIYIMSGFSEYETLMQQLGKYKTGKSCLYIKNLNHVDMEILKQLIQASVAYIKQKYSTSQ